MKSIARVTPSNALRLHTPIIISHLLFPYLVMVVQVENYILF